jgi:hypothetical protein
VVEADDDGEGEEEDEANADFKVESMHAEYD